MIPKRIFYVWSTKDKKPRDVQACIQTWRQAMPDYEIVELNEENTTYFDYKKHLQNNKWFKTVYENKMWAFVADYIRIHVLYDHGGIYFDTDVSVVKSFDKFLNDKAFVGMQDMFYTEPAVLGAEKHNKFLKNILSFYDEDIWKMPIFTIPEIFAYYLTKKYNIVNFPDKDKQKIIATPDITIYPERFFIPFRFQSEFSPDCVGKDTYSIHWFGGSWTKPSVMQWLKNKHINPDSSVLNQEVPVIERFSVIGKLTILKLHTTTKEKIVYLLHIPILKINQRGIYLFKFLRLFKRKQ